MPNLFQATVVGHAGGDAKQKFSDSGSPRTEFTLAYTKRFKDQDKTFWVTCTAFGKTGEYCLEKIKKGDAVYVSGDVDDLGAYARKQDGQPIASFRLTVNKFLWLRSSTKSGAVSESEIPVFDGKLASTVPADGFDDLQIPF